MKEHSKKQTLKIAAFIGDDPVKFRLLIDELFSGEKVVSQRASWVLSTCAEKNATLVIPYHKKLLSLLDLKAHPAVKRNIVKVMQFQSVQQNAKGMLAGKMFALLNSNEEPVAVKAYSLTVLFNLCLKYPGLIPELKLAIDHQLPYSSAGFRARSKKVMAGLEKNKIKNLQNLSTSCP